MAEAPIRRGVVVGAGVGGLAAAICLAARGLRVDVLESSGEAGGKLGRRLVEGLEVDTGPSVLTLPRVLDTILRVGGSSLGAQLELTTPDPAFRYLYPDGTVLDVHHEPGRTLQSVRDVLGSAAALELEGFLEYSRRIWTAAAPRFVFGAAPSVGTLLRAGSGAVRLLADIDPLSTMWGAIRRRVGSEHLRRLLARYATYNGSDARVAPATLNCIAHVELALGGFGVKGGMYEVARALVRVAEGAGVGFHWETPVQHIETAGGRTVGGIDAAGRRWPADAVVANAEATHVFADLLSGPAARAQKRGPRSMSGWVGILRARRREACAARVAHTVLFPRDYLREFSDIFDRRLPPREPTVYLCALERSHGRRGWSEHEPVFLMANAPAHLDSRASYVELREAVLRRVRGAGLCDPDDRLVYERTPADLARGFPGSDGSLYGLASNSRVSAFVRPPNRVRAVPGLYLASGSAHPGGGVPLCLLSGFNAAQALLSDVGLPCHPSITP
jgi:1-hydroxycarotenoid 3,4-desaturase